MNNAGPVFDEAKVRKAFRVSVPSALLLGAVMMIWPSATQNSGEAKNSINSSIKTRD